jgi:CheY-like chemotaxis protein
VTPRCTVLIAARDLLDPLRQMLPAAGEVLVFADSEPLRALEAVAERRPSVVALERLFASSPRGTALINRIKADPVLAGAEILVMSHDTNQSRTVQRRADGPAIKAPVDQRGTRRAPRIRIRPGVEVMVDGATASLIDLSVNGAQVISPLALRPNARVRVTLNDDQDAVRIAAVVAWARFEIPQESGEPRYRAGIEFVDAETKAIERLSGRWKA